MFAPQGCEGRCGEAAPLVVRIGIRLFHPAQPAGPTDLVIDGEHFLAVQGRRRARATIISGARRR